MLWLVEWQKETDRGKPRNNKKITNMSWNSKMLGEHLSPCEDLNWNCGPRGGPMISETISRQPSCERLFVEKLWTLDIENKISRKLCFLLATVYARHHSHNLTKLAESQNAPLAQSHKIGGKPTVIHHQHQ